MRRQHAKGVDFRLGQGHTVQTEDGVVTVMRADLPHHEYEEPDHLALPQRNEEVARVLRRERAESPVGLPLRRDNLFQLPPALMPQRPLSMAKRPSGIWVPPSNVHTALQCGPTLCSVGLANTEPITPSTRRHASGRTILKTRCSAKLHCN